MSNEVDDDDVTEMIVTRTTLRFSQRQTINRTRVLLL